MSNHSSSLGSKQYIYDRWGKIVGVVENRQFHAEIDATRDMWRSPEGIGWDEHAVKQLRATRTEDMFILEEAFGVRYYSTLNRFMSGCLRVWTNTGYRLIMPLTLWDVIDWDGQDLGVVEHV